MSVLGLIPARGGSKGIPRKNLAQLGGKPLIAHTIESAIQSKVLDRVIVSTEDEEIASTALRYGAEVPFVRPSSLAQDSSLTSEVVGHALEALEKGGANFEQIMLLQPTCPFRTPDHIRKALQILSQDQCESVVSVVRVFDKHPFRMKRIIGGRLINFIDQGFEDMRPRQSLPEVFIRNGLIYLVRTAYFKQFNSLVGKHCFPLVMTDEESINIDDPIDLIHAEIVIQKEKSHCAPIVP